MCAVADVDRVARRPEDRSPKGLRVQSAQENPEALQVDPGCLQRPPETRDEPGVVEIMALVARQPLYDGTSISQERSPERRLRSTRENLLGPG